MSCIKVGGIYLSKSSDPFSKDAYLKILDIREGIDGEEYIQYSFASLDAELNNFRVHETKFSQKEEHFVSTFRPILYKEEKKTIDFKHINSIIGQLEV